MNSFYIVKILSISMDHRSICVGIKSEQETVEHKITLMNENDIYLGFDYCVAYICREDFSKNKVEFLPWLVSDIIVDSELQRCIVIYEVGIVCFNAMLNRLWESELGDIVSDFVKTDTTLHLKLGDKSREIKIDILTGTIVT